MTAWDDILDILIFSIFSSSLCEPYVKLILSADFEGEKNPIFLIKPFSGLFLIKLFQGCATLNVIYAPVSW